MNLNKYEIQQVPEKYNGCGEFYASKSTKKLKKHLRINHQQYL